MRNLFFLSLLFFGIPLRAQIGPGIGVYPTGTEAGLSFRSGKDTRFAFEERPTRVLFNTGKPETAPFVSEISVICRVIPCMKVRFWEVRATVPPDSHGLSTPVGREPFRFTTQNYFLIRSVPCLCFTPLKQLANERC